MENLEKQDREVKMEAQELQDQRVKTESQVNEVDKAPREPLELEAELARLDQKVQKVVLAPQVLLAIWDPQDCKGCLGREEALELLDPKGIRVSLVQEVEMDYLGKMD